MRNKRDVTGNSTRIRLCQCSEQQQLLWILNNWKYFGLMDTCFLKAMNCDLCSGALQLSNAHWFVYLLGCHSSTSMMFPPVLNLLNIIYLKGTLRQIQRLHFVCQVRCNTHNCNIIGSSHLNNLHTSHMTVIIIMH